MNFQGNPPTVPSRCGQRGSIGFSCRVFELHERLSSLPLSERELARRDMSPTRRLCPQIVLTIQKGACVVPVSESYSWAHGRMEKPSARKAAGNIKHQPAALKPRVQWHVRPSQEAGWGLAIKLWVPVAELLPHEVRA